MKYSFSKNNWFLKRKDVDPQVIGERLEKIRETHGRHLKSEDVLEDAKHKNSPLHDCFEWDDSKAAHQHRLQQASQLITIVTVEMPTASAEPVKMYCSVRKMGATRPTFIPTAMALKVTYFRNQVLQKAMKELERVQNQYGHLQQLERVFVAYQETKNNILKEEAAKAPKIAKVSRRKLVAA